MSTQRVACPSAVDDFSRNGPCFATIQVQDCRPNPVTVSGPDTFNNPFVQARCVIITQPFVLALLAGDCRDKVHGFRAEVDCLWTDHPLYMTAGLGRYVNTYMVGGGFAIAGKTDYNGWSRGTYNNAPAVSNTEEAFMLPIREGVH